MIPPAVSPSAARPRRSHTMPSPPPDDREPLAAVRLYAGLEPKALAAVRRAGAPLGKDRDGLFFQQGDDAEQLHLLLAGRAKLSQITAEGRQRVVRYAAAGELLGCVELLAGSTHSTTATAVTACEVLCWNRPALHLLMQAYPRIALNALTLVAEELLETRTRYRELATARVERQVARALLREARKHGHRIESGGAVELGQSPQEVAKLAGATPHVVTRILDRWESRGLVEAGARGLVLCEPGRLLAIAEERQD